MAEKLLTKAETHVKELEDLEDYYFEADRQAKISASACKVIENVDKALASLRPVPQAVNARGLFLKGRASSFIPDQEAQAEELLSKALKLEPKLLGAWNALGEVHWNAQNYQRARESFERALEFCGTNSVSLRGLSMVLRAVDSEEAAGEDDVVAGRRAANFAEALEKAKAAVALDASDPQNWETLGNAYVGDFFVNARRPDELSRALIAYEKAETAYAKLGKSNPSLQLNRGMAAKYIEHYELALTSFRKAQDIGAVNAAQERRKVVELVQRVSGYTNRKGDLKAKHLKELTEGFKGNAGSASGAQRSLRDLQSNAGSADTPLVAKVVSTVDRQDELPMIIICCDGNGDFFALSLYNAQPSKVADSVIPMKSLLQIQQPKFREVSVAVNHKTWRYPSVRVAHPADVTVVGVGSLGAAAVQSKFSAAALPREPQDMTPQATPASDITSQSAATEQTEQTEPEVSSQVDPTQERWIDQEDARMKKEVAKAQARAKAEAKLKNKAKKNQRPADKIAKKAQEVIDSVNSQGSDSDAELETNTGSESCQDNDKDEKEIVEEIEESTSAMKPSPVRWSDLDDSDSDDGRLPQEMAARAAANLTVAA
jgi:tetratricopeptide (TPR) repeat protein